MELFQKSSDPVRHFVSEINQSFLEEYGRGSRGYRNFGSLRRQIKIACLLNGVTDEIYSHVRCNLKDSNVDHNWNDMVEGVQDAEWLCSLYNRQSYYIGTETSCFNEGQFDVDEDGHVIVYTDGACPRNGQPDAQAGIGVWFGYHHNLNVGEPLNCKEPATNNVAEIKAVIEAIQIVKSYGVERVAVHTDSKYLINSATKWILGWLSNDWLKSNGEPVKHKKQYRELLMAMENMDIKWVYVKAHSHHDGNIEADLLARQGAQQYLK